MSQSPTYVSRLDPQFRRFVNVVNVYPSSETSASNDDLSKDGAASVASSSCSEINQEFISVDAYTEENWPPPQSPQRQVSEFYLEYANILSSESEVSLGNDNDITACSLTSPILREEPRNLSNSEQRYRHDRIRNDCFGDDSVFWSDGNDESSHEENGINQCLQKRPVVSNKRPTLRRPPIGSFSSEADSESSYRYRNEIEGSSPLEHFIGGADGFFAGEDKNVYSPVSRRRNQEVISRNPQGTSRKIADSFNDLSSIDSELGYAPDVIEDGYSSTSSADSSFVCFALVGKQDDKRTKRKMASKNGRGGRHKKHRQPDRDSPNRPEIEDKSGDRGLTAYVVSGISGGPAIRVFRDEESIKSKSRPLDYPRENVHQYVGRTTGDFIDHSALEESQFQHESIRRSGRDSVFALFAAPGNPSVKEVQSGGSEGKWDVERVNSSSPAGAVACGEILPGSPGNYAPSKPYGKDKETQAMNPGVRVAPKHAAKYDELSRHADSSNRKICELVSSDMSYVDDDNVKVMSNSPGNTASDYQWSSQDKLNNGCNRNLIRTSKKNEQSSISSKQISSEDSPRHRSDEGNRVLYFTREKQMHDDPLTRRIMPGDLQEKGLPLKLHSIKRDVSVKAIRKSSSKSQRPEKNLEKNEQQQVKDTMEPSMNVSELKLRDAKKISQETDSSWSPREKDWTKMPFKDRKGGRCEDLSKTDRTKQMGEPPLALEPVSEKAFGSSMQLEDYQATGNLELKVEHPKEQSWLVNDGVKEEYTGTEAKTGLLTPVRHAIHKTIQSRFLDNGASDNEWKFSSNEEDQVCPEFLRDESSETESTSCLDVDEDQKTAAEVTEGLQTISGDVQLKVEELEDMTEIKDDSSTCREVVDTSIDESHGVTAKESLDTITSSKSGRVNQESELEYINLLTKEIFDSDCQPVKETCDYLHGAKGTVIESQQRENDNRRSRGDASKLSSSASTQQRTLTPVTKRKHPEDERQETDHSKKSKPLLETSPQRYELRSKLSDDLPTPGKASEAHSVRRSSDTAGERVTKAAENSLHKGEPTIEGKGSKPKAERRTEEVFLEDDNNRECLSGDNILHEEDDNNHRDDNGDNGFSSVPAFKTKVEEDRLSESGSKKETSEGKVDTIATHKQDNQNRQEDEKSAVQSGDVTVTLKDETNERQPLQTVNRHHIEDVSPLSSTPSSKQRPYTHVPKRTIPKDKKQGTSYSMTSKSDLESSTKGGDLHSQSSDDMSYPSRAGKVLSLRESFGKPEENLAKAVEFPRRSLGEVEPSDKVKESTRDFVTEKERRKRQSFEEYRSKGNADSSTTDFRIQSEAASAVQSAGMEIAEGNASIHSDTKDATFVPYKPQEGTTSPKAYERFDWANNDDNAMSSEETLETSATDLIPEKQNKDLFIVTKERVEKEDWFLEQKEHVACKDSKADIVTPENALNNALHTSSREMVDVNRASGLCIANNTSPNESNVSFFETKLSSVIEESFVCEKAIDYFTQQPNTITTLPETEAPRMDKALDMSEKSHEEDDRDPWRSVTGTALMLNENLHPLALTADQPRSVSGLRRHQGADNSRLVVIPEAVETSKEEHEVTEDICFVAFDDKDGALDTTELVCSTSSVETSDTSGGESAIADSTSEPKFSNNEIGDKVNTFVTDSKVDSSSENASPKKIRSGNVHVLDGGVKTYKGVKEVVCRYEEIDCHRQSIQGRETYDITQTGSKSSSSMLQLESHASDVEQNHSWASAGVLQGETQINVSEKAAEPAGHLNVTETHIGESTACERQLESRQSSFLSSQSYNEVASPSNAERKDYNVDTHGWTSCHKSTHCDCLQRYLLQKANREEERNSYNEPVTSAIMQKIDIHSNLDATEDTQTFHTFRADGFYSGSVVKECLEQQCQVALIEECFSPPECKNKESQTSFSYMSVNDECQTDETYEVNSLRKALQQQSIECQTELQSNVFASVGVQVKFPDYPSADKLLERENTLAENRESVEEFQSWQEKNRKYIDKDCQTAPDNELLLTTSRQCQASPDSEESFPFATYHDTVMYGRESSHHVFSESRECQTSENDLRAFIDSGTSTEDLESYGMLSFANKECQPSLGNSLVTSSTQCEILTAREGEEELISKATLESRLISTESKGCQTVLDSDLLHAASKECQTSPWSYTSEEIEEAGVETEISYASKESQTLLDSELLQAASKESQTSPWSYTSEEITKLREDTVVSYESKECQTVANNGPPLQPSKQPQTIPEFAADGAKRVSEFQLHQCVAYNSRECQTEPYDPSGLMNDDDDLSAVSFQSSEAGPRVENTQAADILERNKSTYEAKESQTTVPDSDLISTSEFSQTSNLDSAIDYHNKESQTLPDGDMFIASSKECQTVPYSLDDLKLLVDQMKASQDVELFNDAEAEEYSIPSDSPQMGPLNGTHRPSTYGKSPEADEVSSFEFHSQDDVNDSELCQNTVELAAKPVDFALPIALAEIGCQAVLCHCGKFVDEHENESSCSRTSNNPQNGYLIFFNHFVNYSLIQSYVSISLSVCKETFS